MVKYSPHTLMASSNFYSEKVANSMNIQQAKHTLKLVSGYHTNAQFIDGQFSIQTASEKLTGISGIMWKYAPSDY